MLYQIADAPKGREVGAQGDQNQKGDHKKMIGGPGSAGEGTFKKVAQQAPGPQGDHPFRPTPKALHYGQSQAFTPGPGVADHERPQETEKKDSRYQDQKARGVNQEIEPDSEKGEKVTIAVQNRIEKGPGPGRLIGAAGQTAVQCVQSAGKKDPYSPQPKGIAEGRQGQKSGKKGQSRKMIGFKGQTREERDRDFFDPFQIAVP